MSAREDNCNRATETRAQRKFVAGSAVNWTFRSRFPRTNVKCTAATTESQTTHHALLHPIFLLFPNISCFSSYSIVYSFSYYRRLESFFVRLDRLNRFCDAANDVVSRIRRKTTSVTMEKTSKPVLGTLCLTNLRDTVQNFHVSPLYRFRVKRFVIMRCITVGWFSLMGKGGSMNVIANVLLRQFQNSNRLTRSIYLRTLCIIQLASEGTIKFGNQTSFISRLLHKSRLYTGTFHMY